ncbi:MAG: M56 family metallopeptidase, partial [Firmicutes bacterium]|nr:M56 family metallopeptidase [Bacillota bacterium]
MLTAIFVNVLRLSVIGAVLIALAAVLRLLFRKIPRAVFCAIWVLIALRLVLPVSLESSLSLLPARYSPEAAGEAFTEYISEGTGFSGRTDNTAQAPLDQVRPGFLPDGPVSVPPDYENENIYVSVPESVHVYTAALDGAAALNEPAPVLVTVSYVWLAGTVLMLAYAVFSYLKLRRRVAASVKLDGEDRVFICDDIDGAFILGMFRPRIYLPSGLAEEDRRAVLAHEKAHLARFDHVIKPLFFAVLAVHWFDPLVWAAYAMLCRDIEFACDEKVLRGLEPGGVQAYSNALLACGSGRFRLSASPLAFGETGVRERVKAALRYKKPTRLVIAAAALCVLLFAGCTVSRPAEPVSPDPGPATQTSGPAVQPSGPAAQPSGSTAQTPGAVSPGTESAAGRFYTEDGTVFSDLEGYLYYLEGDFFGTTSIDGVDVENSYIPSSRMELYECKPYMSDWKGYAWGLAF